MNERERFVETVHFGKPDRIPFWDNLRKATVDRWLKDGLPSNVYPCVYKMMVGREIGPNDPGILTYGAETCNCIQKFFGFDRFEGLPINSSYPSPPFEQKVLEENEKYIVWVDSMGAKRKDFKHWPEPGFVTRQWLEFPVKNREDFVRIKERYDPHSQERYPKRWDDLKRFLNDRDFPLYHVIFGPFWFIRDLLGLEMELMTFYRNPGWMLEMIDFSVDFQLETMHKALEDIEIDCIYISEDMAYKGGPMISPSMAREFLLPAYRRISKFLRENGVDVIVLDSDGDCAPLIPVWLEGGINGVSPFEVAAGMDIVAIGKKYKDIILFGGIDKRVLSMEKAGIERELMSKVPFLVRRGGCLPHIDHAVPADAPLDNYLYYCELFRKVSSASLVK